ncbi:MAG: DUF5666 domain-containing protein [Woeseiaceae bacterium]
MKTRNTLMFAMAVSLVGSFAGCGGGSEGTTVTSTTPTTPSTGGIGRNGIAVGPISTFGSVVVNGVTYNTDSATFTVNDQPGTQSDLAVGDVITVVGTIDSNGTTGTANTVMYDDVVKGPVESVDLLASSLVVLGQTVLVRPETSFDDSFSPVSLDGVSVGQIIEVSGQFDADGNIVATRLEPKPAGTQFEVHGIVSGLDSANMTFNLSNLVVDYSAATLDNFTGGQISEGDFVEAKGLSLSGSGVLLATAVELESLVPDTAPDDRVEVEGFIDRFSSATDFDVAGFTITTTANTVYEGGDAADLGLNIKVEVEGDVDANGIVVATKVDIRRAKAVRVTALVDSVDSANDSLVVLGITVTTDELTRFEDKSNADVDPLSITDINTGDYVEIRGDEFPAGSGDILATVFEREDPDPETTLQGFVESSTEPAFSILGVTIQTDASTVFRDENEVVISSADFFARLAVNDLVKAEGSEVTDSTIVATEVEFELEF